MLNVTVLNGVMLHVVMLNVVALSIGLHYKTDSLRGGIIPWRSKLVCLSLSATFTLV